VDGIGIHVSTGNYNIIVRNNICHNNRRQGLTAHEVWDSIYENNIIYSNGQGWEDQYDGIGIYRSKNITVRRNTVYNNQGWGVIFWNESYIPDTSPLIENNVVYNNQKGGIALSHNVNSGVVYHNTIASNQGSGLYIYNSVSGHTVKNNLLFQNATQIVPGSGNNFDYNLYYPDVSFSAKGNHSVSSLPSFVDLGANDYELNPGSPGIDQGDNVGISVDRNGTTRPQFKAYDIGAYECSVSNIPNAPSRLRMQ
jgi:parallel beta-helix repeat protein